MSRHCRAGSFLSSHSYALVAALRHASQACLADGTGCSTGQRCDTTTNPSNPVCKPICNSSNGPCNANCLCTSSFTCLSDGNCAGPCSNSIKDGVETDIDCGGGSCPKCGIGQTCKVNTDCQSNVCHPTAEKCVVRSTEA